MALPYRFLEDAAPVALGGVVDGFTPRKGCPRPRTLDRPSKAIELERPPGAERPGAAPPRATPTQNASVL